MNSVLLNQPWIKKVQGLLAGAKTTNLLKKDVLVVSEKYLYVLET